MVESSIEIKDSVLDNKKAKFKMMPKRLGDQLQTKANIDKARRILNYKPSTTLKDILKKQIIWYKEKIYAQGLHEFPS